MSEETQAADQPAAVEVEQVLKSNYLVLTRLLAVRVAVIAVLVAVPFVLESAGVPDSFVTALPFVAAVFLFIFTVYRVRCGVRIMQCARVLRHYPLEFRQRVDKKKNEWTEYGNVYTIRLPVRGQHGAPTMLAINAAGPRRWPEGTEKGVWFAGDSPFGGVMIVPGSNAMMFLNPEDWEKQSSKRAEADVVRIEKAELAKLNKRNWKRPVMWLGG